MDVSFEFFPPKTAKGMQNLLQAAQQLSCYQPDYFSVTYGAGGSTQVRTMEAVVNLRAEQHCVAPHISCLGATKHEISTLLKQYQELGIKHLVCLRGDMASGAAVMGGDFRYAVDLVHFIREITGAFFDIKVAVYPESHPQASCMHSDLQYFKEKVAAGANSAITQYFFDANAYYQLLEDCARLNINVPIIPGVMPIYNYPQLQRFSDMCGAEIPRWIRKHLESFGDDIQSAKAFSLEVVMRLCEQLVAYGAPGLHFYTLNKTEFFAPILAQLGFKEFSNAVEETN